MEHDRGQLNGSNEVERFAETGRREYERDDSDDAADRQIPPCPESWCPLHEPPLRGMDEVSTRGMY